jgi:hypothetical protein
VAWKAKANQRRDNLLVINIGMAMIPILDLRAIAQQFHNQCVYRGAPGLRKSRFAINRRNQYFEPFTKRGFAELDKSGLALGLPQQIRDMPQLALLLNDEVRTSQLAARTRLLAGGCCPGVMKRQQKLVKHRRNLFYRNRSTRRRQPPGQRFEDQSDGAGYRQVERQPAFRWRALNRDVRGKPQHFVSHRPGRTTPQQRRPQNTVFIHILAQRNNCRAPVRPIQGGHRQGHKPADLFCRHIV